MRKFIDVEIATMRGLDEENKVNFITKLRVDKILRIRLHQSITMELLRRKLTDEH